MNSWKSKTFDFFKSVLFEIRISIVFEGSLHNFQIIVYEFYFPREKYCMFLVISEEFVVGYLIVAYFCPVYSLHKKWGFPLRISSVNVTKSAGNCRFGPIYRRNPNRKLHFLCSDCLFLLCSTQFWYVLACPTKLL